MKSKKWTLIFLFLIIHGLKAETEYVVRCEEDPSVVLTYISTIDQPLEVELKVDTGYMKKIRQKWRKKHFGKIYKEITITWPAEKNYFPFPSGWLKFEVEFENPNILKEKNYLIVKIPTSQWDRLQKFVNKETFVTPVVGVDYPGTFTIINENKLLVETGFWVYGATAYEGQCGTVIALVSETPDDVSLVPLSWGEVKKIFR